MRASTASSCPATRYAAYDGNGDHGYVHDDWADCHVPQPSNDASFGLCPSPAPSEVSDDGPDGDNVRLGSIELSRRAENQERCPSSGRPAAGALLRAADVASAWNPAAQAASGHGMHPAPPRQPTGPPAWPGTPASWTSEPCPETQRGDRLAAERLVVSEPDSRLQVPAARVTRPSSPATAHRPVLDSATAQT